MGQYRNKSNTYASRKAGCAFVLSSPTMQKLYSEIIGMPVCTEYSKRPVALVQDVIVDPENGKILAFRVKNDHMVVPLDVERFSNELYIAEKDRILPIDEVLRVFEVAKHEIHILGSRVSTDLDKLYLGRVVDYEIDTKHMNMSAIHVAKTFFFFRFQEKIISARSIIKINKNSILVKSAHVLSKASDKGESVRSPVCAA